MRGSPRPYRDRGSTLVLRESPALSDPRSFPKTTRLGEGARYDVRPEADWRADDDAGRAAAPPPGRSRGRRAEGAIPENCRSAQPPAAVARGRGRTGGAASRLCEIPSGKEPSSFKHLELSPERKWPDFLPEIAEIPAERPLQRIETARFPSGRTLRRGSMRCRRILRTARRRRRCARDL